MKFLTTFITFFLVLNNISFGQFDQEKVLNSVFIVEVEHGDLKSAHGANPSKVKALRETLKQQQRQGSGFVISQNNAKYLVTCLHVIEAYLETKSSIVAKHENGQRYTMKLVGADSFYDIAILAFDKPLPKNIQPLQFSQKKIKSGEKITAIGYPNGEKFSPSGNASFDADNFDDNIGGYGFITTPIQLVEGISGSPILNQNGQIVGMASKAMYRNKSNSYMGKSLFLDGIVMKKVIDRMYADSESGNIKRLKRLYTGVVFGQKVEANKSGNVYIANLIAKSPASTKLKALKGGILIELQGKKVNKITDVYAILEPLKAGITIRFKIKKDDKIYEKEVNSIELSSKALIKIAEHHFSTRPHFEVEYASSGKPTNVIKKSTNTKLFKIDLAGYEYTGGRIYYIINSKKDLGVVVRLCSDSGSLLLANKKETTASQSINNDKNERATLRLIYY